MHSLGKCKSLLCVTVAPETSWTKTVILWPAERVLRSWISDGTNQPTGPQAKPKEIEYRAICMTKPQARCCAATKQSPGQSLYSMAKAGSSPQQHKPWSTDSQEHSKQIKCQGSHYDFRFGSRVPPLLQVDNKQGAIAMLCRYALRRHREDDMQACLSVS